MNRWIWFSLLTGLCFARIAPADTIQNNTRGKLNISGEIIESTCAIDNVKNDQPDYSVVHEKNIIKNNKNALSAKSLHIHLIDCSLRSKISPTIYYHNADVSFISDDGSNLSRVINTDNKVLGISLKPKNGTLIEFGKPTPDYQFIDEDNNIDFDLLLIAKENKTQKSIFHATLRIYMEYI